MLPIAIDRQTLAAVARRADDVVRCESLQEGQAPDRRVSELGPGRSAGWAAYPHGVAWALLEEGVPLGGVDVVIDSNVPQGSGLSSSAALECAVALALCDVHESDVEPTRLARAGQRAEAEVVGVPTGVMDQMASLLARAGHALFLDTRSLEHEHVPLALEENDLRLVVINTRAPRRLVEGAYGERRAACEAAAATLGVPALRDASPARVEDAAVVLGDVGYRRARHVVTENERVLEAVAALRAGALDRLGPLLVASHESLRDDFEVSSPELDTAVEAALAAGAVGARMTGAGFGGSALALVRAGVETRLAGAVSAAFAARGFAKPDVFAVTASDGAARVA